MLKLNQVKEQRFKSNKELVHFHQLEAENTPIAIMQSVINDQEELVSQESLSTINKGDQDLRFGTIVTNKNI
jgi:hypothetical protein